MFANNINNYFLYVKLYLMVSSLYIIYTSNICALAKAADELRVFEIIKLDVQIRPIFSDLVTYCIYIAITDMSRNIQEIMFYSGTPGTITFIVVSYVK